MFRPGLKRQLSVSYTDPITGNTTMNDPNSYTGIERKLREDSLIKEHPDTGYTEGILERRRLNSLGCRPQSFFYLKKDDDENSNADSLPIPTMTPVC